MGIGIFLMSAGLFGIVTLMALCVVNVHKRPRNLSSFEVSVAILVPSIFLVGIILKEVGI